MNDSGVVFIRPASATALTQNRISEFYSLFPFFLLSNAEFLLWLIHWDNKHWLLYIADIRDCKSFLFDPATKVLSDGITNLWYRLDNLLINLLNPQGLTSLTKTYLENVPLQNRDGDCGLFVCQYAVDFCRKNEFHSPNIGVLRNEINKIVRNIIACRNDVINDVLPNQSTHPVLLEALLGLSTFELLLNEYL